jgi:hypothetical protein
MRRVWYYGHFSRIFFLIFLLGYGEFCRQQRVFFVGEQHGERRCDDYHRLGHRRDVIDHRKFPG